MPEAPKSKSIILDKNKFILEASHHALHGLLTSAHPTARDPKGIAQQARKYAIELWRVMRNPV